MQYGDIFTNTLFINDQKTILALTLSLSLSRDPLLFLSLSLDLFSSSLPPIHRRSTVSPPSPPSLTKAWTSRLSSFSSYFLRFCNLGLLRNHTKALCLSAGAGHAPMAMAQIGLSDVTAVELVDSLPLVRRADPHNLSFFYGAFDFAFTAYLDDALFPWRVVEEMERTVRRGGFCVVAVDECGGDDVREIARLFLKSKLVDVANANNLLRGATCFWNRRRLLRLSLTGCSFRQNEHGRGSIGPRMDETGPYLPTEKVDQLQSSDTRERKLQWMEEPTLLVTRFEYASMFHTVTDWYSAYVSSRVTGSPNRPHVVFIHGHCTTQLEETWTGLFSGIRYAKNFTKLVCFRHTILSPLGYEITLFNGLSGEIDCNGESPHSLWLDPDNTKTARLSEVVSLLKCLR
ncbi:hypothetical protein IGI04_015186 [Brassica rapa subsp. trilocularis]|uniref:Methyltransferase type 11 domain-containing protein n=1 Tax=Brassica rapa subsp. trilocularis TaxID=1813537 RepID=A0ABQ7MPB3_BRACM|nr:hypothetical protein IGI04_015186 [Brassica rapa subsp. trilocularis]